VPQVRRAHSLFQGISLNLDPRDALLAQIRERDNSRREIGQEVALV
jgi:hypothetical protein